jgi:uncharacterized protein YciI
MFVTFLRFADKARAPDLMAAHNAWVDQGVAEGVFLLVGSLQPGLGGAILAAGESRSAHEARIAADPFVAHGVVTAETHEIAPGRAAPALGFLLAQG